MAAVLNNFTYLCKQEYIDGNLDEIESNLVPAQMQSPALNTRVMREFAPYAAGY